MLSVTTEFALLPVVLEKESEHFVEEEVEEEADLLSTGSCSEGVTETAPEESWDY